jgi:isoleucyl-tRNA synthetase
MRACIPESSPLYVDSIHFTSIPEFSKSLIDPKIERTVTCMQSAIETGRQIRDKIKLSNKYPVRKVRLVDADQDVLDGFKTLEVYIKEELNCVEL